MRSFLTELRRRNVVRVAILYAVVGWVVLQVADLAMPRLGIPAWGVSLVLILVVLGFPIALVFAWIFELTPEGIRRTDEIERHESTTHLTGRKLDYLIIGVLAAAVLLIAYDAYGPRLQTAIPRTPASPPTTLAPISIAVLPFVDMSQAKDQEYLSDGISEELLNALARVEGFKVIGRTSAFAFKGKDEDLRAIGEKLRVDHILEGSVRKQGDRIRITAQLVSAADGYHLWSETYDRQLGDVFAIQDDIAERVVGAISQTLGRSTAAPGMASRGERPPTSNVEAYGHFLRGQYLLRPRTSEGMEKALEEFERAVALDANFARAHAGIARSLVLLALFGQRGIAEIETPVENALRRATSLDPDLADAYAVKALWLAHKLSPVSERIPLLERAAAANPSDAETLIWLGENYGFAGRAIDEFHAFERAYAIDPLAPIVLGSYAYAAAQRGNLERAEQLMSELADLQPDSPILLRTRAELAMLDTRVDQAIRWLAKAAKLDPRDASLVGYLAYLYRWIGDTGTALRYATRIGQITPGDSWSLEEEITLRSQAGDLAGAEARVIEGETRFARDPYFLESKAVFYAASGRYAQALDALLASMPAYTEPEPQIGIGGMISTDSPLAAFLLRQAGQEAQARRIEDSFERACTAYMSPEGKRQTWQFPRRAAMAAVAGNRANIVSNLTQLYDNHGLLPAWAVSDPWFQPYRGDPDIKALFAKFDGRRAEWRKQLAAEGL